MPIVRAWVYRCNRCGHIWMPKGMRDPNKKPRPHPLRCARCKSGYWDRPVKEEQELDNE